MCTGIARSGGRLYFGRNMDYDKSFGEQVVILPRCFPLSFCREGAVLSHYAMIGMAAVMDGYPLFADAINEKGLAMAGLHFEGNARYFSEGEAEGYAVSPYELIPWVLSRCADIAQARELLESTVPIKVPFRSDIPLAPLHWLIADREGALVFESTREGIHLYDNPAGVLANNPPFPFHLQNLSRYAGLSNTAPRTPFATRLSLMPPSRGLGALGLPGDYSSASRFVKAAFLSAHLTAYDDSADDVSEFFHLLAALAPVSGSVILEDGSRHITTYSCCMDGEKGIYYYNTHFNHQITAVNLHSVNLDDKSLTVFPLKKKEHFLWE